MPEGERPLRELAYETLRDAILLGRFSPGDRLREREIASRMGTSTTPVKEAIRRLEREGLVVTRPRRGAAVSDLGPVSYEEFSLIRGALEGIAARLAAMKIDRAGLDRLRAQLDEMERLTPAGGEALVAANTRFHALIREAGGNPVLRQLIESIRSFEGAVRWQALSHPEEAARGLEEHRQILAAIEKRDPLAAEEAIRQHIERVAAFVWNRSGLVGETATEGVRS